MDDSAMIEKKLEGCSPSELAQPIIGDGYHQRGVLLWNKSARRFEFFNPAGGWFGLKEDGTWIFDVAPFCD